MVSWPIFFVGVQNHMKFSSIVLLVKLLNARINTTCPGSLIIRIEVVALTRRQDE